MGYFPNGTSAMVYQERYCSRCAHEGADGGCPVMDLHFLHNYDECNNEGSFLHMLIPRGAKGLNERCSMFIDRNRLLSPQALAKLHAELQTETPPLLKLAEESNLQKMQIGEAENG